MNGILPLWKERGMTSHDCVFKLRKILRTKKVGHTGTLDPGVEGVLPICIGQATRIAEYLTDAGKTYEAIISIGRTTTTEDAEGETVAEDPSVKKVSREQLQEVLASLTGVIEQTPPMFSAVKVNGKRLYEYARKGETVERPTRQVTIYALELLDDNESYEGQEITFPVRIDCSKGTYIRTLAVQIGEALGYPAHMKELVRTASGTFTRDNCFTLAQVAELMDAEQVTTCILPVEYALTDYPYIEITSANEKEIFNGQVLPADTLLKIHDKIVFGINGKAVAVYQAHPTKAGLMKPHKMFPTIE
ncbi:tRNA pseudouridine(55) synthase TruB [Lysinibacillus fusiformis]|uniref:tRNA pseudouridine(55) synthase TruB n=1 Tax=Lysinibacillus fusiformis TaxID=28031 RepID=UPI0011BB0AD3|nr:tRNA pseudouridine(55) synthase TruB [Lysinibacillus fusiformis]KAB0441803.1 tRNA pseudouridine(55) synthase TruB [Lysinibacillus fusiformis]MCE4043630.1 tRNA pseudouridine(55) synthase TruB [Lysinibacillus fusiformis]QEA00263.1 tRNA pseudouridine(55) synthase TruB [Lysinibacillus fusiformis]UXJ69943.1 tRNA pseudouridine(55) synthase TruB [Lysinibacillus fusiformis]WEA40322.1 tRNA pseudouridine(55) synthase TruB [Lysinibacillus fusiformis]